MYTRWHKTFKDLLKRIQTLPEVINILLGDNSLRALDKRVKELDEGRKTLTVTPPDLIVSLSKRFTSYAFQLVMEQWAMSSTSFNIIEAIFVLFITMVWFI